MRHWAMASRADSSAASRVGYGALENSLGSGLAQTIDRLGQRGFAQTLLDSLFPVLPAASYSVYRIGPLCEPAIFISASRGIPDITRDCWHAYLSGPYRSDRTLYPIDVTPPSQISHITAQEVPPEHRANVYEAHGIAERLSIVESQASGALFAINFYRHQHQQAFSDAQIDAFAQLAPVVLALTQKHLALIAPSAQSEPRPASIPLAQPAHEPLFSAQLNLMKAINPALTPRECEVCAGILQGLTFDGIACQLGLTVPTVKTYRNRAFARLGIHFRNQLFALALKARSN
jgi:DNA-binding CsgD family transcriptional regulator